MTLLQRKTLLTSRLWLLPLQVLLLPMRASKFVQRWCALRALLSALLRMRGLGPGAALLLLLHLLLLIPQLVLLLRLLQLLRLSSLHKPCFCVAAA